METLLLDSGNKSWNDSLCFLEARGITPDGVIDANRLSGFG
jgi:hypothetical protein